MYAHRVFEVLPALASRNDACVSLCVVAGAASIGIPILKDFDRRGTAHVTRCEIFYEKEAALSGIATFGFLFLFVIAGSP